MGRNDFLRKVETGIQLYKKAYIDCIVAQKQVKNIEKLYGMKVKIVKLNLKSIIKNAINDSNINYFGSVDILE